MKKCFLAAAMIAAASPCYAGRVKAGYVGCITEKALDEFITAAVNEDKRQMQDLLGRVCIPIGGMEFSMVDQGFMTSEIRVYTSSGSLTVFTPAEGAR
jgi:hypothetical protein